MVGPLTSLNQRKCKFSRAKKSWLTKEKIVQTVEENVRKMCKKKK
jgi:hypothetical protein